MVITPWSWAASNGYASAAQTQAAYTALTTGGMTYSFSRHVWNDIITKINEVANALGKRWQNEYLPYYSTKMYSLYSPLSAKMFNSARYNTNYLTWTWSYDPTAIGYIGRTDFQGVTEAGDENADFVFGTYIIELTERLNTVIGIINGTGSTVDMRETIGIFVEVASELIMASPQAAQAGETFSITHSGTMDQERHPSWTLHFRISQPTHSATLEIGNFTFSEAMLRENVRITENLRVNHPESIVARLTFPQRFGTEHITLPAKHLFINHTDMVAWDAAAILRTPRYMTAAWHGSSSSADAYPVLLPPTAIYVSESHRLSQSGVLVTEQMGLFAAFIMIRHYYSSTMRTGHSATFEKAVDITLSTIQTAHTGHAAIAERTVSCVLTIGSDAHVPVSASAEYVGNHNLFIIRDANTGHSAPAERIIRMQLDIKKTMHLPRAKPLTHIQSESIQHFGEMMLQQIGFFMIDYRVGYSARAKITELGAFPLAIEHADAIDSSATFSLEVMNPIVEHFIQPTAYHALLQSENLPSMYVSSVNPVTWSMEFSFHKPHAIITVGKQRLSSQTEPVLLPPNTVIAEDIIIVTPDAHGEAKMLKPIRGSVLERFLTFGNAKVGYTHRIGGSVSGVIRIDNSELSCARGALELNAHTDGESGSLGCITQMPPLLLTIAAENTHTYIADLGLVRYAYMRANCANELAHKSELETNGEWIYPAQDGKNMYVVQVYETDKFIESAFFDFGRLKGNAVMLSGVAQANVGWIYRCDAVYQCEFEITPNAELSFVNAAAWEYPVQHGNDLTVTQVGFIKQHQHKLEVK